MRKELKNIKIINIKLNILDAKYFVYSLTYKKFKKKEVSKNMHYRIARIITKSQRFTSITKKEHSRRSKERSKTRCYQRD